MNKQTNEPLNGSHEQGSRHSFSRHGNGDMGYSGCTAHLAGQPLMQKQVKGIIFILFLQVIHVGRFPMQRKEPELWQKRCQNDSEAGIYLLRYIKGNKLIRSRRQTAPCKGGRGSNILVVYYCPPNSSQPLDSKMICFMGVWSQIPASQLSYKLQNCPWNPRSLKLIMSFLVLKKMNLLQLSCEKGEEKSTYQLNFLFKAISYLPVYLRSHWKSDIKE